MGFYSADFIILVLDNFIIFRQHIVPVCIDRNINLEEDLTIPQALNGTGNLKRLKQN